MDKKRMVDIVFEEEDLQRILFEDTKRHLMDAEGMTLKEIIEKVSAVHIRYYRNSEGVGAAVALDIYDTKKDHLEAVEKEVTGRLEHLAMIQTGSPEGFVTELKATSDEI